MALGAGADLEGLLADLGEGADDVLAVLAGEADDGELGEDDGAPGDDASDAHEAVEVALAQLAQGLDDGQVGHADVELLVDVAVVDVEAGDDLLQALVEDGHKLRGRVGEPQGQRGLVLGEVGVGDLQALPVLAAHVVDALRVHVLAALLVVGQELLEHLLHLHLRRLLRQPLTQWPLLVQRVSRRCLLQVSLAQSPLAVPQPLPPPRQLVCHARIHVIILVRLCQPMPSTLQPRLVALVQLLLCCAPLLHWHGAILPLIRPGALVLVQGWLGAVVGPVGDGRVDRGLEAGCVGW